MINIGLFNIFSGVLSKIISIRALLLINMRISPHANVNLTELLLCADLRHLYYGGNWTFFLAMMSPTLNFYNLI